MSSDATRARCRQMPVVRCHRVPDAARCQLPDAPPPGPGGGLGEVSRAPVLMSFVLISGSCCHRQFWGPLIATMSDVLTPSSLGSHSSDVRCQTVLFRAFLSPTRPPDIHHLRPLGRRPGRLPRRLSPPAAPRSQTSTAANRRFRPWRPAAAAAAAVAAGWTSF